MLILASSRTIQVWLDCEFHPSPLMSNTDKDVIACNGESFLWDTLSSKIRASFSCNLVCCLNKPADGAKRQYA